MTCSSTNAVYVKSCTCFDLTWQPSIRLQAVPFLAQIFQEAKELLPGGVNSPVRAFKSVGGNPIVFDRVKGPYAWDVDGNRYIDYIGSWGPAIVGAADDEVNEALHAQLEKGTSFGAPCALEVHSVATPIST